MSVDEEARMDRKGRIGLKVFTEYLSTEIYQREVDYPNSTANDFLLAIKSYLFTSKPFLTPADTIFWIDEWTKRRGMSHIRQLYRDMVSRGNYASYVRGQVKSLYNLGSSVPEIRKNVEFWLKDQHFLFARIDSGKKGKFQHPAAKTIITDYFYRRNVLGDLSRRNVNEADVADPFGHHERAVPAPLIALTFTAACYLSHLTAHAYLPR
ncbi:hypothetical protein BT69DRAFT_310608 [Atractiella rhizophila]|nr:hypothetical protein BT69DRAFT_310608 [Atractiella rhizophila]